MKRLFLFFLLLLPVFTYGQNITTIAGTGTKGYSGDGSLAVSAEFKSPNSLVFDKTGNLYITDAGNCVIRKLNTSGIITTVAGNGSQGYSGDNGPATLAQLNAPVSIAVDLLGNLYISCGDYRIRKVNTSGVITTIAGDGTFGYNGDNIPATSAKLAYPYLGFIDEVGNVFFGDYGNRRLRKINTSGIITTVAGDGTAGSGGDGGPATAAQLRGPCFPYMSLSGDIYIPDNISKKIRKVNKDGIISTFAGGGTGGDGEPATNAAFGRPNAIAFDNGGNAYISDYAANVVRKISASGIISTITGTGTAGYSGDGGPATAAQVTPNTLTTDKYDNVYIADVDNHRIRKIIYDNHTAVNAVSNGGTGVSIYPNPVRDEVVIADTGIPLVI